MSINPEKEEADARDDAAYADLLDGGGRAGPRRLRERDGKGRRRDDKDSAKGVFVGVGKKKKKGPPKKKKKAGQGPEGEVDPGPAKKKPRGSKNMAAAQGIDGDKVPGPIPRKLRRIPKKVTAAPSTGKDVDPVGRSGNNGSTTTKAKVPVKSGVSESTAVHATKKAAQRGKLKKVTIPESPVSSQTITSPVAEKGADPIKQVPNYEVLATFESQWNAGNFIHGAGIHLPNVEGSNGQVKSQALQNFVVGLVDDYVKTMPSDSFGPFDEDAWTPEWAWVQMYWIMHQSTQSQQLGTYVRSLSPSHVQACISGYSPHTTLLQMKTWSPESIAAGFWSTDVDNKNFGQYRCYGLDSPCHCTPGGTL